MASYAPVTLITGASSGFGHLTALELARRGHRVYATMRDPGGRNAEAADALGRIAADDGLALRVIELDVTDDGSVEEAVAAVLSVDGAIDVLVNNAGIGARGLIETFTPEQAGTLFAVNVLGTMRVNRAVLPHMRAQSRGLLVYVSSGLGRIVRPGMGVYCATKFAFEAIAEGTRYEVAHLGIDTVIVEPGAFPTAFGATELDGADPERGAGYGVWTREISSPDVADRDPREVAVAIAELIATPAGERALRTPLRAAQSLPRLNEETLAAQAAMLERSNLADHVAYRSGGIG